MGGYVAVTSPWAMVYFVLFYVAGVMITTNVITAFMMQFYSFKVTPNPAACVGSSPFEQSSGFGGCRAEPSRQCERPSFSCRPSSLFG
jgi:hypothetical protein